MFALRNAASVARKKAGFNCKPHGVRHGRRILAAVDGAGEEDTGAAELHGAGGIGSCANTGVDEDGNLRAGADELDIVRVEDA